MKNRLYYPVVIFLFLFRISSAQVFTDSNLPIVLINTNGAEIPDDPRIIASMKIIFRGDGLRNYVTDVSTPAYLNYDGQINIELRGSSSQALDKKQYGFSTKKSDGITSNNVSLLGLPPDNDWILQSNVFDPSMIRNYLSYNLSRRIGQYASRTVFCEVMINGHYMGLYLLLEKIKPATNRVNILEIGPNDNSYPDISGGYITKSDKTTGGDPVAWTMSSYQWTNDIQFIHHTPDPQSVTPAQNNYIESEFLKLARTTEINNQSVETGYPSIIDVPTFIDYMLLTELSSNADGYSLSTFYHKDRNGKVRAGPLWDFDLTYGNDLFLWGYDRSKTDVWQFSDGGNDGPRYWKDLFDNAKFKCYLSKRWNELTKPGKPFNYQSLVSDIDQVTAHIGEAVVRENTRWGTVGNHAAQIAGMKTFLQQRINWITNNIGSHSSCDHPEIPPLVITRINYAPDTSAMFPVSNDLEFIEITNTGNEAVNLTGIYFGGTGFVYNFRLNNIADPGQTIILAGNSEVFMAKYGFYPSGQFTRSLSNTGEDLILSDGFGNEIDRVQYSDLPPWPDVKANGLYLELVNPLSDNNIASSWRAASSLLVSVNDIEDFNSLRLYPSPVNDLLTIENETIMLYVELYDIMGTKLQTLRINSECCNLDMSSYPRGLYLVRVVTPGGSIVRKIIRN
ncbi:MAG: CotH kinase family protein [Bacteroidales bacterium]|nr:CotH kinase family protein [Bacteroidales bacterium]